MGKLLMFLLSKSKGTKNIFTFSLSVNIYYSSDHSIKSGLCSKRILDHICDCGISTTLVGNLSNILIPNRNKRQRKASKMKLPQVLNGQWAQHDPQSPMLPSSSPSTNQPVIRTKRHWVSPFQTLNLPKPIILFVPFPAGKYHKDTFFTVFGHHMLT